MSTLVQTAYRNPTVNNNAGISSPLWDYSGGNVLLPDDTYAKCALPTGQVTDMMVAYGFGFAIPSTAQIVGVEVNIERSNPFGSNQTQDWQVAIFKAVGTYCPTNHASGAFWPISDAIASYGNALDLWGFSPLTPADINNSSFGVGLRIQNNSGTTAPSWVDNIQMRISYVIHSNMTMVV